MTPKQRQQAEEAWLGLGDTSRLVLKNPFFSRKQEDIEQPHIHLLKMIRDPRYFGFTCKHILNRTLGPFQIACLWQLWKYSSPMFIASRGFGKSFLLGVYAVLRALINQGSKVVIVGSGFRQAKGVFEYAEKIWNEAPVLRDLVGSGSRKNENGPHKSADRWVLQLGESTIVALPVGDGQKIRGARATHLLVDEFPTLNPEIFEVVIRGFGAVSADPIERMRQFARFKALKELGALGEDAELHVESNQTVLAGTAYYSFNHFYRYWQKYRAIIMSRGDRKKLAEIFQGEPDHNLNWRDFCVVRVPYELIPEGYMDEKTVANARATMNSSSYVMEFGACHSADSNGFFRRSLIERCVVSHNNPIEKACGLVHFSAALRGKPGRKYVMAVDPASEQDNFAVVILELWPDHRRIVHCWTTNRPDFKSRMGKGMTTDKDFYRFTARKIRDLHKLFPCEIIAIDAQGGGIGVMEALGDTTTLGPDEKAIYLTRLDDGTQPTDDLPGEHIVHAIQFASSEWVSGANHGLKNDLEGQVLLFPEFDQAALGLAIEEDEALGRAITRDGNTEKISDTLEDCMQEIEFMKDELATIVISQTAVSGRERWDTPEIKLPGMKKGRMRKDRYSALLMANMEARVAFMAIEEPLYEGYGRFAHSSVKVEAKGGPAFVGPGWYMERQKERAISPIVVRRG